MRRGSWKWLAAACLGLGAAACSAILGLDAPPAPDAGSTEDAAPPDNGDAAPILDAGNPVCTPIDASVEGSATTYFPLSPVTIEDAGMGTWDWFDMTTVPMLSAKSYAGGTFDGRYIYFAGRLDGIARYDTHGNFLDPMSWSGFRVSKAPLNATGGFTGADFDGRYVYFIPYETGGVATHILVRYDTQGMFGDFGAWATFDTTLLADDSGIVASGFLGGVFDGRYLYLVPHNDGAPDGRLARYDTTNVDGFGDIASWSTYDMAKGTANPLAIGFSGAVFDGVSLYFAPQDNGAFNNVVHNGASSIAARLRADAGLASNTAWSAFDISTINGEAFAFAGAGFDGRYVYYAPHGAQVAVRYDTQSTAFGNATAWSTYDVSRIVTSDAATASYAGTAFDGRFIYFIPAGTNFATIARYDTRSTFTADCAWSTADLTQINAGGIVPGNYYGAVFDGQYVYLIPNSNGLMARFKATTPGPLPGLPYFNGSFL